MTVYGEEHQQIDISKGLWLSPTPDAIPDGYCPKIQNMFQTERGTWQLRKGFTEICSVADTNIDTANSKVDARVFPVPEHQYQGIGINISFGALSVGKHLPQIYFQYQDNTSTPKVMHHTGRKNSTDTVEFKTAQGFGTADTGTYWGQYKDLIYTASDNTLKIIRYSGFAYGAATPAITSTNVGDYITAYCETTARMILISYANRMWQCYGNKLQYTEVAASGGYPETWTVGNVIEIYTDNSATPDIKAMFVFNGILYLFTTKGIFALNGQGSPSSWSLNFISNACPIYNKHAVALVNGAFILTNYRSLFIFNGSSIKQIGSEIDYLFNIYNSFSICPFEDGFILAARYMSVSSNNWTNAVPPGGSGDWSTYCRAFYFNGTVWTEIVIGTNTDIIFGVTARERSAVAQSNLSYLILRNITTGYYSIVYYDKSVNKDTVNAGSVGIVGNLQTRDIHSSTKYTQFKKYYARIFSLFATVGWAIRKNGSQSNLDSGNLTLTTAADNNYLEVLKGTEQSTRANLTISISPGTSPTIFDTDLPDTVPIFEIKELGWIGNTDTRDITEQKTN